MKNILIALMLFFVVACDDHNHNRHPSGPSYTAMFTADAAGSAPRVYLQAGVNGGGVINIDVVVEGVDNLYGADIVLTYDPTVLNWGRGHYAGSLLETSGSVNYFSGLSEDVEGKIVAVATLLGEAVPVSGKNGVVITIPMKAVATGESFISLEGSRMFGNDLLMLDVASLDGAAVTVGL